MASLSMSTCLTMLPFLFLHYKMLTADASFDFALEGFDKDPSFASNFAFYGDAKAVDNATKFIQLTDSVSSSAGRLMYKKPINLVKGNPRNLASFSTYFSFVMSPGNGDGLAFFMVSSGFNATSVFDNNPFGLYWGSGKSGFKVFALNSDNGHLVENHAAIDVGGFVLVKMRNATSVSKVWSSGKRLHAWIDYEAGSKRLEVRLSRFGDRKPADPLLWDRVDLPERWNHENVFVGLSSSNGNSSQTCFLYSWNFKIRRVPHWMHSQPLDPQLFAKDSRPVVVQNKSDCLWRMLAAMIFGTACGALVACSVLYLWTIFGKKRPVVPENCSVHPVDFEYKKVRVVVDKAVEGKQ